MRGITMKKSLWIVLFLLLTLLLLRYLPDGIFDSFVSNNIEISGDGEIGMNNFDSVVIAIKLGVSAIIAAVVSLPKRRLVAAFSLARSLTPWRRSDFLCADCSRLSL